MTLEFSSIILSKMFPQVFSKVDIIYDILFAYIYSTVHKDWPQYYKTFFFLMGHQSLMTWTSDAISCM